MRSVLEPQSRVLMMSMTDELSEVSWSKSAGIQKSVLNRSYKATATFCTEDRTGFFFPLFVPLENHWPDL